MTERNTQGWSRAFRFRRVAEEFAEFSAAELKRLESQADSDIEFYRRARELVLRKLQRGHERGESQGGGR
jgi:hypothetical protein